MANALNEDLEGRVVILAAKHLDPALVGAELRAFRVRGGFVARSYTSGNALFGTFLFDGEDCRMEGWMVERIATDEEVAQAEAVYAERKP